MIFRAATVLRLLNLDQIAAARAARRAGRDTAWPDPDEAGELEPTAAGATRLEPDGSLATRVTVPWLAEAEPPRLVWGRRVGRALLYAVLGLACLTGVRTWLRPATPPPPPPVAAETVFPRDEAAAAAEHFARAYLELDQDVPERRDEALRADLPAGADPRLGWDGRGYQRVLDTQGARVEVLDATHARVRVYALTQARLPAAAPGTAPFAQAAPRAGAASRSTATPTPTAPGYSPARWVALEVPVAAAGPRVVVTGPPGRVGAWPPAAYQAPRSARDDTALSTATRAMIAEFMTAYADGRASGVAAPGAQVAGLDGSVTLVGVESWTVWQGVGDTREGRVAVRWADVATGSRLGQTYRVTITQVTGAGAERWQVASISGGDQPPPPPAPRPSDSSATPSPEGTP